MKLTRLKHFRELAALTQTELAQKAGVGRSTVAHIEAGAGGWPSTARKLAKALGVKPRELMEGDEDA